jgi:hypothetical protein
MNKRNSRSGSALILALVIALLAAGLAGAFMALTTESSKSRARLTVGDEAQQICDAGLEIARAALLKWRNADPDPKTGQAIIPATKYAWNKVFAACAAIPPSLNGVGGMGYTWTPLPKGPASTLTGAPDANLVRADALARFKSGIWTVTTDNDSGVNKYNYDTTNVAATMAGVNPLSSGIDPAITNLFGVNRRYGKGAFHLMLINDLGDLHGNGTDDAVPASGNPWGLDPTDGPGVYDPLIDGNGTAILFVTATLPDGTVRQVECVLAYPFPGSMKGAAIQANGDITLNGAFAVEGTLGSVQANGNISGNGSANAIVQVSIDASGSTAGLTMQNKPQNGINSGAPPLNIQPVDVSSMKTDPKYSQLQSRMYVLDSTGGATWIGSGAAPGPDPKTVFTFKSGTWSLSGGKTAPANAVYFVDGNVSMSGQGNTTPYNMTVIATGSVEMTGNAAFAPATTDGQAPVTVAGNPIPTNSFGSLLVAGTDVSLRGTASGGNPQYQGSVFANEQVEIRGNFSMNGSITAADATDTPGSLVSSQNSIGPDLTLQGNPTIIDNGTASVLNMSPDHLNVINLHRLE